MNAITDSFIGVRVATVKFIVSPDRYQRFVDFRERTQSNFAPLVLETETTAYVIFALQAIFGNEIADLSADELKNNQDEKMDFAADREK